MLNFRIRGWILCPLLQKIKERREVDSMTTLPQGDFEINNINSFANKMRCSVPVLNKLNRITEGNFNKIQKIGELTGNVPCRYCGQSYGINGKSEREIWIGMYFNNIIFTPEYLFVLGIHVDKKDKELLTKITRTEINFQFYNFPTVDEKWIFITLDNYFLHCDIQETETEINRILQIIL